VLLRLVLIKLKPEFRGDGKRRLIAKKTLEVLPNAARVMNVTVQLPKDQRTEDAWDLCLHVHFASLDDTEVYRLDPIHRAFVDVFLKPMLERIQVFHLEEYKPLVV
jgi:hypothetical protein